MCKMFVSSRVPSGFLISWLKIYYKRLHDIMSDDHSIATQAL